MIRFRIIFKYICKNEMKNKLKLDINFEYNPIKLLLKLPNKKHIEMQ